MFVSSLTTNTMKRKRLTKNQIIKAINSFDEVQGQGSGLCRMFSRYAKVDMYAKADMYLQSHYFSDVVFYSEIPEQESMFCDFWRDYEARKMALAFMLIL